jgi:D-alanyl-D-alanine carboxypeptidase
VGKSYFKPGKGWHYSNTNYLILGVLAERIDGRPLGAQLQERFFDPLGLDHTYDQVTDKPSGPVAHGYRFIPGKSKPVDLSDGSTIAPFTSVVTAARGAGSLASTPADLVHWVRALYNGTVVSPASVQAMFDDIKTTSKRDPAVPYGLGVQGVELDGHAAYGHSGRLLGFRSLVRWLPDERMAIAVLSNQSRTDPAIIARSLLRLALASQTVCVACREPL